MDVDMAEDFNVDYMSYTNRNPLMYRYTAIGLKFGLPPKKDVIVDRDVMGIVIEIKEDDVKLNNAQTITTTKQQREDKDYVLSGYGYDHDYDHGVSKRMIASGKIDQTLSYLVESLHTNNNQTKNQDANEQEEEYDDDDSWGYYDHTSAVSKESTSTDSDRIYMCD